MGTMPERKVGGRQWAQLGWNIQQGNFGGLFAELQRKVCMAVHSQALSRAVVLRSLSGSSSDHTTTISVDSKMLPTYME